LCWRTARPCCLPTTVTQLARQHTRSRPNMPMLLPPEASDAGENDLSYPNHTRTHRAESARCR
jgi:hypothetical protein